MALFSDILLTVDFDRTLTAADGSIPKCNLEAIRFFTENGGAFTVNTGRSLPMARVFLEHVPINAPLLLFNGGGACDMRTGEFTILHPISLNQEETVRKVMSICPDAITEIQGVDAHYAFRQEDSWDRIYEIIGCPHAYAHPGDDMGPFVKLAVFTIKGDSLQSVFSGTPETLARFDRYEAELKAAFGDSLSIFRSTPVTLDIQAAGVNKGLAARELAQQLHRRILICVGDERNDIGMLDMADYAFCPADGKIAPYYSNVCCCSDGAVADVIYKKIPEILGVSLDIPENMC